MLFKVTGLTKSFGGLVAVDDLSFHIEEGEIVSIIGPNGAGKSTVFNLITGFIRPTHGSVSFKGEEIVGERPFVISKKGITRTFQLTTVFTQDTVFDNLVVGHRLRTRSGIFGALLRGSGARTDERRCLSKAEEILEFIGLAPYRDQIAANIPQEAQKKLSLGMALATAPSLLLLDEPTGGVNLEEDDSLIRMIQRVRDSGVTICLIEHKMKVVMGISNRVVVLNYGKKIAEGSPEAVSRDVRVIEAYLGPGYAA